MLTWSFDYLTIVTTTLFFVALLMLLQPYLLGKKHLILGALQICCLLFILLESKTVGMIALLASLILFILVTIILNTSPRYMYFVMGALFVMSFLNIVLNKMALAEKFIIISFIILILDQVKRLIYGVFYENTN